MSITGSLELISLFGVAVLAPNINFFLPVRPTFLTIVLAAHMPWFAVGMTAVIGGVVGVIPLYEVAYKASETKRVQRWLHMPGIGKVLHALKNKLFLLIVLLVVTPLPDQLIGLSAGAQKYPFGRFLLANLVGRALIYLPLAYLAAHHQAAVQSAWTWAVHLLTF